MKLTYDRATGEMELEDKGKKVKLDPGKPAHEAVREAKEKAKKAK
jgi:hypothetical protein